MWTDIFLGVLFVVSGFVKAVDPVGLSYKIEEYLGMFQLSGWSGLSMLLSVLLCAAELTLGTVVAASIVAEDYGSGSDSFYPRIYDTDLFDLYGSLWWYK